MLINKNKIINNSYIEHKIHSNNAFNKGKNYLSSIIKISFYKKSVIIFMNFLLSFIILYHLYSCEEKNIFIKDTIKYDIVIPVNINDTQKLLNHIDFLKRFLNFENIIIITRNNSKIITNNHKAIFINEDELIPINNIKEIFLKRGINENHRIGWYEQQFLKMSYSTICKNDYYLLWDADTIPIKNINMFYNNHPIFDMKEEYHHPYFATMENIISNLHFSKFSYISEHMIIKTEFMKSLIFKIEKNQNIPGKFYYEKILMSIDRADINKSGFSEFETYGTFVDNYYPYFYKHRKWYSQREMVKFYSKLENLNDDVFKWLSKDYDAITFEKWDKYEKENLNYVKSIKIHKKFRPKRFFNYYKRIIKNINLN